MSNEFEENEVFWFTKPNGAPQYYTPEEGVENLPVSDPYYVGNTLEKALGYRTSYLGGKLTEVGKYYSISEIPVRAQKEPPFSQLYLLPPDFDEEYNLLASLQAYRVSSNPNTEIDWEIQRAINSAINRVATTMIMDVAKTTLNSTDQNGRIFYFFPEFNMAPSADFRNCINRALNIKYSEDLEQFFEIQSGVPETFVNTGKRIFAGQFTPGGNLYSVENLLYDLSLCRPYSNLQQLYSALYYLGASGLILESQFGIEEDVPFFPNVKPDLLVLHTAVPQSYEDPNYVNLSLIRYFSQLLTKGKPKGVKIKDTNPQKSVFNNDFYTNPVLSDFLYYLAQAILTGQITADLYEFKSGCVQSPYDKKILTAGIANDISHSLLGWVYFITLASRGNTAFFDMDFYGLNSLTGYYGHVPTFNPRTGKFKIPQESSVSNYPFLPYDKNSEWLPLERVKRQIAGKQKSKTKKP